MTNQRSLILLSFFLSLIPAAQAATPAKSQSQGEVVVNAPVERSELSLTKTAKEDAPATLGFRASYWSAQLPETGSPTSPLMALDARLPLSSNRVGALFVDFGGVYARFGRSGAVEAGELFAKTDQAVHWLGASVGVYQDLPTLRPNRDWNVGAGLAVIPSIVTASDSLAGPAISRFELPVMASMNAGWTPDRKLPLALEAQVFANYPRAGVGIGAGIRISPERGAL